MMRRSSFNENMPVLKKLLPILEGKSHYEKKTRSEWQIKGLCSEQVL